MDKAKAVAWWVAVAVLKTLRFVLYVFLMMMGRVVEPLLSVATGLGLLLFLVCAVFMRQHTQAMWGGAGLAAASAFTLAAYQAALRALAPAGTVIISEV